MAIVLVGLNHRTAPLALREQFSLSSEGLDRALNELAAGANGREPGNSLHEGAILSTCNRLEIFAVSGDAPAALSAIERFLLAQQPVPPEGLRSHLYVLHEREAVEHVMRVASGLDSRILGEPQIQGQVADAFARAKRAGTAGPVLSQLFGRAIHAGKRARAETDISRHTISVSHAATRVARDALGALAGVRVLVVGAGEMAELAAAALWEEGARQITCINRTHAHAELLARRFGGRALTWGFLADALAEADVVVSATGAPHAVIYRDDITQILPRRMGKPLVIVDIAVPRDVEPGVGELAGVLCFDIDHLQDTVDGNRAQREAAVPQVEAILQQEAEGFFRWLHGRQVVPVLVELRCKVERMAQAELDLALRRLDNPDPRTEQLLELLVHRIVGKVLHEPTIRLKSEAANGNGVAYTDALRELFGLDGAGDVPDGLWADADAYE